jgi:hypothetical protein
LDTIVDLMRLFPCLEKLHVKVVISSSMVFYQLRFRYYCCYILTWLISDLCLSFQSGVSSVKNYWRRKHRNFIKCHDIRLKDNRAGTVSGNPVTC